MSRETAKLANRGDALALKAQSALRDFAIHLKETFGKKYLERVESKNLEGRTLSLARGDGVKNNQPRTFVPSRMGGLKSARQFVNDHKGQFRKGSLIPHNITYREYKSWAYRTLSEFRQASPLNAAYHYHGNRHYFSHREYAKAWRHHTGVTVKAPVVSNVHGKEHIAKISAQTNLDIKEAASLDQKINLEVAEKLGHHRVDSGYSYNGK